MNKIDLMTIAKRKPTRLSEVSAKKATLSEYFLFEVTNKNVLKECSEDPNKKLVVSGLLQRAGVKNRNGRVYPKEILMRESLKYNENYVKQRRALGELDHPNSGTVELKNCSHIITELHWEGNDLVGTVEILPTPSGNILKQLLLSNVAVGISSRGIGTVKQGMTNEGSADMVQEDFELLSFDFVSDPSVVGAFMVPENASLNESVAVDIDHSDTPIIDNVPSLSKEEYFEQCYQYTYDCVLKRLLGKSKSELINEMI